MRVRVARGGGLAGLSTVTTLDSQHLEGPAKAALRASVASALAAGEAPGTPGAGRGADLFSYELTVEDGASSQTLRRTDANLTPELRELLGLVMSAPERERHIAGPGQQS